MKKLSAKEKIEKKKFQHIRANILSRCYNPNSFSYKYYGGCGYTVCDDWINNPNQMYFWAKQNHWNDNLSVTIRENTTEFNPINCIFCEKQTHLPHLDRSKTSYHKKAGFFKNLKIILARCLLRW